MSVFVDHDGEEQQHAEPETGHGWWSQILRCASDESDRDGVPGLYRRGVAMLFLREYGGMSLEEVAQVFKISRGRALRKIRRTQQALQAMLRDEVDAATIADRLREQRLNAGKKYKPLADSEWQSIAPLLDHRGPLPARSLADAVLWKQTMQRPWHAIPPEYASHETARKHYRHWQKSGAWEHVKQAIPQRFCD